MAAIAIAGLAMVSAAHAQPGGTSSISGSSVRKGEVRIEARSTAFIGDARDDSWAHRVQAGYGIAEWWRVTAIVRASQPADENTEASSIAIENKFDITPTREGPVHFAVQAEYEWGFHGRDDGLELKLIAENRAGRLSTRLNLVGDLSIGGANEWEHSYSAHAMWRHSDALSFGVEAFGEFDVDAQAIGPRINVGIGEATLGVAYLVGFNDAEADGQLRLAIEASL